MKPILYAPNTTDFTSNGIGPLSDCISCKCTQSEGTYELTIVYPTTGIHFKDISFNYWLKVVIPPYYEESPQLFYIVKVTRPINKRITIVAHHVSYRLSYLPIAPYGANKAIKNLFNGAKVASTDSTNWKVTWNKSKLTIQHKTTDSGEIPSIVFSGRQGLYLDEGMYIISFSVSPSGNKIKLYVDGEYVKDLSNNTTFGVTDHQDGTHSIVKLEFPNSSKSTITYSNIQVEAGTEKTDYEAFKSTSSALLEDVLEGISANSITEPESFPFVFDTDVPTNVMEFKMEEPCSAMDILGGNEGSVLAKIGGYFTWDNYHVHHLTSNPDRGYKLKYGVNITNLSQEENIAETVTGVVPYWYDSSTEEDSKKKRLFMLPEQVLYCENYESFAYKKVATVDFSDQFDEKPGNDKLREVALFWLAQNKAGIPKVSLDVDFVELSKTDEYKDLNLDETINLYDQVTVIFPELNVETKAVVTETIYDVLLDRYENVKIGEKKKSEISSRNSVSADLGNLKNTALTAVANSSNKIIGGTGGFIMLHMNEETEQPDELYIMDKPDPEDAKQIIRINKNGIGFSTNGGKTYNSAWTIDGKFNASFIKTGVLDCDVIRANQGKIKNLDAGEDIDKGYLNHNRLDGESTGSGTGNDVTVVNWNSHLLHMYFDNGLFTGYDDSESSRYWSQLYESVGGDYQEG